MESDASSESPERGSPPSRAPRRALPLFAKLVLAIMIPLALVALVLAQVLVDMQRREVLRSSVASGRMMVDLLAQNVGAPMLFEDVELTGDTLDNLSAAGPVLYAAVWSERDASTGRPPMATYRAPHYRQLHARPPAAPLTETTEDLRLVTDVVGVGDETIGKVMLVLSLAEPMKALEHTRQRIQRGSLAIAAGLVLLLGWFAQRVVVHRIEHLTDATKRLERGEQLVHDDGGGDEIGELMASFSRMAEAVRTRQAQIERRNADMQRVMDHIGQGFVTLGPDQRMVAEHSAVVETWLGTPPAGATFADYLARTHAERAEWFDLGWQELVADVLPRELCLEQMPRRVTAGARVLDFEYRVVDDAHGQLSQVILVISDVSELIETEVREREQREKLQALDTLMSQPDALRSFFADGHALIGRLSSDLDRNTAMRQVHTLKGNCSLFGLESVARECQAIESAMAERATALLPDEVERLRAAWQRLSNSLAAYLDQGDGDIVLDRAEYRSFFERLAAGEAHEQLQAQMRCWQHLPVQRSLNSLAARTRRLAEQLGKPAPTVAIDANGLRLPERELRPLWSSLAHLARNLADHGIEEPERRMVAGKPTVARLHFSARETACDYIFEFSDDGPGVDWTCLRSAYRTRHGRTPSERELVDFVLSDGVSTRSEASGISGRGVGMAAVREATEALGGSIDIESTEGGGTTVRLRLPRARFAERERAAHTSASMARHSAA
ncbi:MAG: ATP-binding protein [Myxococcales bacterium]|nr:ATP-binding protein [Myxococcales bacterium]